MGSHWAFMTDSHARSISDDIDGSTFEHNIDYPELFWISTRCDVQPTISRHTLL